MVAVPDPIPPIRMHVQQAQIHTGGLRCWNSLIEALEGADPDIGKVIGRNGRIANALRTIVQAAAMKRDKKATVEILS